MIGSLIIILHGALLGVLGLSCTLIIHPHLQYPSAVRVYVYAGVAWTRFAVVVGLPDYNIREIIVVDINKTEPGGIIDFIKVRVHADWARQHKRV